MKSKSRRHMLTPEMLLHLVQNETFLMPAQGNKGVMMEMCSRRGTCTYLKCPWAEMGMWPQRRRPQISLTSSSPISVVTASVQTAWDWALCLHEWEDDEWDSYIKLTKHVNLLLTENKLVIVALSPPSILVNTSQGFCYYMWIWFLGSYSLTGQRQKEVSMSTYLSFFHSSQEKVFLYIHLGSPQISWWTITCIGNNSWQESGFDPSSF